MHRPLAWLSPVRLVTALTILIALLACCAAAQAAEGFAVSPLRVDLNVDAGSSASSEIMVTNTMDSRSSFTVGIEDFAGSKSDPNSTPILLGGAVDSPISGASWISVPDTSFALDPDESKRLSVKISAPAGATGGHYAAVTISAAGKRFGDSLVAQSRVATLFLINAGGVPPPEIVVEKVTTTKPGQTIIDYFNPGRTETSPFVKIRYRDPVTGEIIGEGVSKDCSTALPGSMGRCRIPDDVLRKYKGSTVGWADGEALLVTSSDSPTVKAPLPRRWSGSWTSALLPLVGLALMATFFLRLRGGHDDEEDVDPLAY